jgi:RimJ/RimL family protein N-acetyltransferase
MDMPKGRLGLRTITESDLPDYVRWLNDPEVTEFMLIESGGHTLDTARAWLEQASDLDAGHRAWAIEGDGRHIGNCALNLEANGQVASFGIVIGEKTHWNRGYGTAAVQEALRIGFQQMGLHRVHLDVFAGNRRGIRCYEKCGFRREGLQRKAFFKRGEWIDVVLMAILREEWTCSKDA